MFGCANCCINDDDDEEDVGRTPTDDAVGSAVVLLSIGAIRGVVSTPGKTRRTHVMSIFLLHYLSFEERYDLLGVKLQKHDLQRL